MGASLPPSRALARSHLIPAHCCAQEEWRELLDEAAGPDQAELERLEEERVQREQQEQLMGCSGPDVPQVRGRVVWRGGAWG